MSSLRHGYRDKDFLLRCVVHETTERFLRATNAFRPSCDPVRDVALLEHHVRSLHRPEDRGAA